MTEPWLLTDREAREVVENTRRGARDPVEHINKAFVKASEKVSEKMEFPKSSREALGDVEYWDKRLSAAHTHVKSLILRGEKPSKDEALGLLKDCATVARALLEEFRSTGGRTDRLEPLLSQIEGTVKKAEKGRGGKVHPVDIYRTLESAIEANDERRLVLLPDADLRRAYLHASLDAVRKISALIEHELHAGNWHSG